MPLSKSRYGVAISWERVGKSVDLDLQAVIVNSRGIIVDAVYHNRLEAIDRALTHSGDEQCGDLDGFDETIWVNIPKLGRDIKLIIFVVAVGSGHSLKDADGARVHVIEKWQAIPKDSFPLQRSVGSVVAIGAMARQHSEWSLTRLYESAEEGNHFMDILEPTLGTIIRQHIAKAPKFQTVSFPMRKGTDIDLPNSKVLTQVRVAVGWEMGDKRTDLDLSAVFFNKDAENVGAVYYNNYRQCGVVHGGDNETGEGDGDDETVTVNLAKVPQHILQIFFIVNIYTKDVFFDSLQNAYCCVTDSRGSEMLRFELCNNLGSFGSGLVIARLQRSGRSMRWSFQATGAFCRGRKWMDPCSMEEMKRLCRLAPRELQLDAARQRRPEESETTKVVPRGVTKKLNRGLSSCSMHSDSVPRLNTDGAPAATAGYDTTPLLGRIFVGVGWDILVSPKALTASVDLDVSAVFFHADGRDLGAVDYENQEEFGIEHSGDNKTGEGDGDDEVISVDLSLVPDEVSQIFFVVTVYTKNVTFSQVENAFCRVVTEEGQEVVRYILSETCAEISSTALVISQLYRDTNNATGWVFKARRAFSTGRTWLDPSCVQQMKQIFHSTQNELNPPPHSPQPPGTLRPRTWRSVTWTDALGVGPVEGDEGDEARARIVSL